MNKKIALPLSYIKILGGRWKGRKLLVANYADLRPSPALQRKRLFDWLALKTAGSRVLDLFSGSGSLGFEAASRDAGYVQLLEKNQSIFKLLKAAQATLQCDNMDIIHVDTFQYLQQPPKQPFDIIFVDPPFALTAWTTVLNLLKKYDWLADEAYIYLESPKGSVTILPEGFNLHKTAGTQYLQVQLYQFSK